jgi:hypothetical protein
LKHLSSKPQRMTAHGAQRFDRMLESCRDRDLNSEQTIIFPRFLHGLASWSAGN